MKAGYSHKTASPFADMLAFRKVTCFLDLNIYRRTKEMYTAKRKISVEAALTIFIPGTSCHFFDLGQGKAWRSSSLINFRRGSVK
jgi:hypothetical protein